MISALNISRYYSYAEITEIRRDRREDFQSLQDDFSCKASIAITFLVVCCICPAAFVPFSWLNSAAEEQPADLVRQIVIAHDVNLPLIECSNTVDSAVDEIKQIGG